MVIASLFKNGRNQAVRLPKEFEFSDIKEVEIRKEGGALIITPIRKGWKSFASVATADEGFLSERDDIIEEERVKF